MSVKQGQDQPLRRLRQGLERSDVTRLGILAHSLGKKLHDPIQIQLTNDLQVLFTHLRQQALGILDVIQRLLGGFRVGIARLERTGLLQFFPRLLQPRVVHPKGNFVQPA